MSLLPLALVILSWTNAVQNEDGSALTDLAATRLYFGVCEVGDLPANPLYVEVTPDVTSYEFDNLADGEWCFRATHVNASGVESRLSGLATKTVVTAPLPPTDLVVNEETAYGISQSDNVLRTFPVGTVPIGTPCDNTMSVNGLYRVDKDAVTYPNVQNPVKPPVVVAVCSGSGT